LFITQGKTNKDDLTYWNQFVAIFFSQRGVFRFGVKDNGKDEEDKQYEITYPAMARFFHTHFDSGVRTMHFILEKGTMDRSLPNDCHSIENPKAKFMYCFEDGSHVSLSSGLD
jgi:hypothetical protein